MSNVLKWIQKQAVMARFEVIPQNMLEWMVATPPPPLKKKVGQDS
jgi:hypothetical protein